MKKTKPVQFWPNILNPFNLYVNHLNQRKSPSAPLVSQEIETDFFRRRFSRSHEKKVPEVADVPIVRGGSVFDCGSWLEVGEGEEVLQEFTGEGES